MHAQQGQMNASTMQPTQAPKLNALSLQTVPARGPQSLPTAQELTDKVENHNVTCQKGNLEMIAKKGNLSGWR